MEETQPSSVGKKNIYTCHTCGGHIVTVDKDHGVTPFMLRCASAQVTGCSGTMRSSMYRVFDQKIRASHEWYKPSVVEEAALSLSVQEHTRKGGLLLRPLAAGLPPIDPVEQP
jgi:hypothetical protein